MFLPNKGPEGDNTDKIPVIVQVQGYDTVKEEFYHFTAAGALPRGYAVLTFDAPGASNVRWELAHGILAFGVSSGSDVMDISQSFTLDRTDGTSLLADISCPTLVTDARDSVFRLDAQRIYDNLTQLKGGHTKIIWSPGCISDGSLQAKVAAFSHMHARFFGWLDGVFDINRPPPQTVV
ncbi:putative 2,6-dihydropseudooxynicotine hydrolase [Seiridium cardinale]|uniref:2,6-dihydropseudooxynicotine hydrolase n=1 Tax=Seiridium cardinale TaxID=138064 RepID=A0ABR2XZJ2_9PEZI